MQNTIFFRLESCGSPNFGPEMVKIRKHVCNFRRIYRRREKKLPRSFRDFENFLGNVRNYQDFLGFLSDISNISYEILESSKRKLRVPWGPPGRGDCTCKNCEENSFKNFERSRTRL